MYKCITIYKHVYKCVKNTYTCTKSYKNVYEIEKNGITVLENVLTLEEINKQNEKIFLDITLSDHSGVINAKLWENVNLFSKRFNAGDFVAVKGKPLTYYNKLYINIFSIKRAEKHIFSEYGFQSFVKNNDHKKIL